MEFEWDPDKARSNVQKHSVSFEEATEVFSDPNRIEILDSRMDYGEDRWETIGFSCKALITVVYTIRQTEQGEITRIISARKADKDEKAQYGSI